jgi:hypothetical protein
MCQNSEIFRILTLFSDMQNSICTVSTSTGHEKCRCVCRLGTYTVMHSYWWKKPRHFTWPVRVFGISQMQKKLHNPEIPRILPIFSYFRNSTCSALTDHDKYCPFCHLGTLTEICTAMKWKSWDPLPAFLCKVFKSGITQILRFSGFGNFFRICELPNLSTLTAMWSAVVFFSHRWCVELYMSNQA